MKFLTRTSKFTSSEYLTPCLESFCWGLYSGVFVVYLQCSASKERTDVAKNITFYALCVLYALSTAVVVLDITCPLTNPGVINGDNKVLCFLYILKGTLFACCDFIAQSILIYRCWIVWHRNIRVVIIPSILAIFFLAVWIAGITAVFTEKGPITPVGLGDTLTITGLVISMTVNAFVTGLTVFRIFKIFREVKLTMDKRVLNVTCGTKLRSLIFVIIESSMVLFSIQLARLVATIVFRHATVYDAFQLIASIHQMINGITPTIILVRVSMGLSFHDEASMIDTAESFLRFTPDHPIPLPGIGCVNQDEKDGDIGGSDDIQMVYR